MTTSIDVAELNNRLQGSEPMTLLDVRRKADADADPRSIAGAAYRNPEKIDEWVKELPTGKPAVVYCVKGGSVSQSVTELLRKEGPRGCLPGGRTQGMEGGRPTGGEYSLCGSLSDRRLRHRSAAPRRRLRAGHRPQPQGGGEGPGNCRQDQPAAGLRTGRPRCAVPRSGQGQEPRDRARQDQRRNGRGPGVCPRPSQR